jgi:hypothetical protein
MGVSDKAAGRVLGPATMREAVGSIAHEQNVGAVSVLQRMILAIPTWEAQKRRGWSRGAVRLSPPITAVLVFSFPLWHLDR